MKRKNLFVLLLPLIFVIACNQTNEKQSIQISQSFSEKELSILAAKKEIVIKGGEEPVPEPEPELDPEPDPDPDPKPDPKPNNNDEIEISEQEKSATNISGIETESGLYIVSDPNSIHVYVNKKRRLPAGYTPSDLVEPNVSHTKPEGDERRKLRAEAAEALEKLFSAAAEDGLELAAISGYRSNQLQATLYNNSIARNGQAHADQFSARPGTSEHESGLAMDISAAVVAFSLEQVFESTDEGRWLSENSYHHGFIIRYPKGKEEITGYAFEPWHVRYVGNELAEHLYKNELTLEEYFGYH